MIIRTIIVDSNNDNHHHCRRRYIHSDAFLVQRNAQRSMHQNMRKDGSSPLRSPAFSCSSSLRRPPPPLFTLPWYIHVPTKMWGECPPPPSPGGSKLGNTAGIRLFSFTPTGQWSFDIVTKLFNINLSKLWAVKLIFSNNYVAAAGWICSFLKRGTLLSQKKKKNIQHTN